MKAAKRKATRERANTPTLNTSDRRGEGEDAHP
jgi:hypothetical protein